MLYMGRNNQWSNDQQKMSRTIMFKPYNLLVQCVRAISTLAGPSEYQCNCSFGPPRIIFISTPVININPDRTLYTACNLYQ